MYSAEHGLVAPDAVIAPVYSTASCTTEGMLMTNNFHLLLSSDLPKEVLERDTPPGACEGE
jgi:hypothetical protein